MSVGDTRPDLPPLPSAAEIVRYMRSAGWTHGRQGSHGAMWTRGDVEFSVPHEDHNPNWLREVVGRLASAEGRTPETTAAAIAEYRDAGAAAKDCGCSPLEPCGPHLARGPVASVSVPTSDDSERALPGAHGQARPRLEALSPDDREALGRLVREVWVACAREHPAPKPSWLAPWEELGEWDKETDRRIGASLALHGAATAAARMHELHVKEIAAAKAQLAEVRQTIAAFFTHHGNSAAFALQTARDLAEGIRQVLDRAALEALTAVCTGPDCGQQFADSETSEYLFATRERMERLLYADGWQADPVLCRACQEEAH